MKQLWILFLIGITSNAIAHEDSVGYYGRYVIGKELTLSTGESQLKVSFHSPAGTPVSTEIKMVVSGDTLTPSYIDSTGTYIAYLTPGPYQFVFLHPWWYPVPTTDVLFQSGKGVQMDVYFEAAPQRMPTILFEMDKPVIYLYPNQKTQVDVKLNVNGTLGFTYPAYKNGWNVTAYPDGTLEQNGTLYNYLFWEAKGKYESIKTDAKTGFVVHRDSLISFFEKVLGQMNLNTKEQQDFITYWVPRMKRNEYNYVHFLFNTQCNQVATLEITPRPTEIFRVFMVWDKCQSTRENNLLPQSIEKCTRQGFTVVEWGGSEFALRED